MILTSDAGIISAITLRDTIKEITGVKILVTKNPTNIRKLHIRYGSSLKVNCEDTEYNNRKFIRMSSNKLAFASCIMENKDLFDVPIFRKDMPEKSDFPLLIRESLTSFGGRGIIICKNMEDFENNWNKNKYWVKFTKVTKEFRLHVLGGKVVRAFKKLYSGQDGIEPEFPIRNLRGGNYRYCLTSEIDDKAHEIAYVISEKTGGKFFGLDIGIQENGRYFVFEANSSPGISRTTSEYYANYLIKEGILEK